MNLFSLSFRFLFYKTLHESCLIYLLTKDYLNFNEFFKFLYYFPVRNDRFFNMRQKLIYNILIIIIFIIIFKNIKIDITMIIFIRLVLTFSNDFHKILQGKQLSIEYM